MSLRARSARGAHLGLGHLVVRAHRKALVVELVVNERGEQHHRQVLEHRVILDLAAKGVPVHRRHFDVGHDKIDVVRERHAVFDRLFLPGHQPVPGVLAVDVLQHLEAVLFQVRGDQPADGVGVVHNEGLVGRTLGLGDRRLLPFALGLHGQGGIEVPDDLLHVEQQHDVVRELHHAREIVCGERGHVARGRLHLGPAQAVDARDARNHEGVDDLVELRDDDLGVVVAGHGLAEPHAQVDQRDDAGAQIERADHARMRRLRHAGDLGQADDLQYLGHVDAIVGPVRLDAFLGCLVDVEFDDFEFVGPGFEENVGLRHRGSLPACRFRPILPARSSRSFGHAARGISQPYA